MRIEVDDLSHKISLVWEYKIRQKKKIVEGKEYSFFSATFPSELRDFLDTDFLWISEEDGILFVLPFEEVGAKKIRLSKSGRDGCSFSLSRKVFPLIEDMDFVRIVFDGERIILSLF